MPTQRGWINPVEVAAWGETRKKEVSATHAEAARKMQAARTPEQRSETARKMHATHTPEERSEAVRKWRAARTPEEKSEAARKWQAAHDAPSRHAYQVA
jgi:hypothetical protein